MSEQAGFTINTEQEVSYTRKERSYLISKRDWNRLSRTIEDLKPQSLTWSNVAWGFLGIGVSCLVSWFAGSHALILIIVGFLSLGVSICAFFALKSEGKHYTSSIDRLKEVLIDIESAIVSEPEVTD